MEQDGAFVLLEGDDMNTEICGVALTDEDAEAWLQGQGATTRYIKLVSIYTAGE